MGIDDFKSVGNRPFDGKNSNATSSSAKKKEPTIQNDASNSPTPSPDDTPVVSSKTETGIMDRKLHHEISESGMNIVKVLDNEGEVVRVIPNEIIQKLDQFFSEQEIDVRQGGIIDDKA